MASTVLVGPDGKDYTVEHPDGISEKAIIAYAQDNFGQVAKAKEGMFAHAEATMERLEKEAQRRGEIGEQFYEPTTINDFELNDPFLRFKLSRTEKLSDALTLLQSGLGDDEMAIGLQDPNGGRLLGFVREGSEGSPQQFYTIDSPNQITMSDIADAGGVISFETLASVAVAFDPRMKAASWIKRTINDFVGAAAGKIVDEGVDWATGLEEGGIEAAEALEAGIINSVFGRLADIAPAAVNVKRGAPLGAENPARAAAVKASIDQGLPTAQVGGPLAQKSTDISSQIGSGIPGYPGVEELQSARKAAVASKLEENVLERELAEIGDTSLLRLVDNAKGRARSEAELSSGMVGRMATKEQGGQAVFKGMDEFAERTRPLTTKAYDDYLDAGSKNGLVYDLNTLIEGAENATKKYKLSAGSVKEEMAGLVDANGNPIMKDVLKFEEFGVHLDNQLRKILDQIKKLDPQQTDPGETTRALKLIRTNLIELAELTPGRGGRTPSQGVAAGLLNNIHNAITLPKGSSGEVKELFEKASSMWKARAKTLDAFAIRDSSDAVGAGELLFNRLSGNITEEHVKVLKKELSSERFEEFRGAVIDDMLRDPKSIESKLTKMGRGGDILVPPVIRDSLRTFQRDIKNIDTGILNKLFEMQGQSTRKVGAVLEQGTRKELDQLIDSGAVNRADINSHILQDTLEKTTHYVKGKLVVIPGQFVAHVEKLKRTNFWNLLSDSNKKMMQDLENYTSFVSAADQGTSIAAADIAVAQLTPLTNPGKASAARIKQVQIGLLANLANTQWVVRLYAGAGPSRRPYVKMRATIIGTLQVLDKMSRDEKKL